MLSNQLLVPTCGGDMSEGLKFRKMDLHTHTPASRCFLDKTIQPEDYVKAAIDSGLDAVAVTDHNCGVWIDKIKEAAKGTSLVIFPGVEITVMEGFHIIALFDVDKGSDHITGLLGALGIDPEDQGLSTTLSKEGVQKTIDIILEKDGLPILAHIDSPSGAFIASDGAFITLRGNPRIRLFNESPYCAVETISGNLPAEYTKGNGFKRFPACYQASDNPDPDNPTKHSIKGIGSRYSFFKLDSPINLEGLRQCFADPEVRIRIGASLLKKKYPAISEMFIQGGFFDGERIVFHPGLNSIIGGKGAGKSLIVELLRFALEQPSDNN
jgi:hypothetical protein